MLGIALFLLISIPWQTKWFNGMGFFSQPRFWPALAIIGLTLFSIGFLVQSLRARNSIGPISEQLSSAKAWIKPLEYVAYFLLYVYLVPIIGYLLATGLFCIGLVYRGGFRKRFDLILALTFSIVVVVIFKTLLQVKIPGGVIYQYLPDALRNFMIINF